MKLKLDLSLPRWVKLRVGLRLGLDEGAAIDVKLKLAGGDPVRWKLALAPGKTATKEPPVGSTLGEAPPVARLL
jgi:hypothetical protein